jgi:hypothetical protein
MNLTFIFGVHPVRKDEALNLTLSKMNIFFIIPAIPIYRPRSQPRARQALNLIRYRAGSNGGVF